MAPTRVAGTRLVSARISGVPPADEATQSSRRGAPLRGAPMRLADRLLLPIARRLRRASPSRPVGVRRRPDALSREGGGRLDRRDALLLLMVFAVALGARTFRLDTPRSMYFDEDYHARTAAEFLQGWRYGMPHDIYEWTHPHLAKYAIAAGMVAFGGEGASSATLLGSAVRDAAFEPTYASTDPAAPIGGDRVLVATGASLLVANHGRLDAPGFIAVPGASAVVVDPVSHQVYVGTDDGSIQSVSSASLAALDAGSLPTMTPVGRVAGPVLRMWSTGAGSILVLSTEDRLFTVDAASGSTVASATVPGVRSLVVLPRAGRIMAVAATTGGLVQLDVATLAEIGRLAVDGGAMGLDLVDGSPYEADARDLLPQPTLYVATGFARMLTVAVGEDGSLTPVAGFAMPGPVADVRWSRPTNLVHVLGKTPTGTSTVYVIEPHGNAVFADAPLPFEPVAWILDVQPSHPGSDRERSLAFAASGTVVATPTGNYPFAWRFPGVLAGALMMASLYLLARLLFRRRAVGVVFAILLLLEGMLFQQSRIAMNDVFVGLFAVAGLTVLAFLLRHRPPHGPGRLESILGPPALGLLFGLALASKWVGLYALGAALLIVLFQTPAGRRIALLGFIAATGMLGYLALATAPVNATFVVIVAGLTLALAVTIARAGDAGRTRGALPAWTDPRRGYGLPFLIGMACLLLLPVGVYVASYVPWALSAAGGPQLFAGWPAGHTGQTLADLQAAMYAYHDEFRLPHGAASPWWTWPLALKPIWGYLETFLDGSQATVLGASNVVIVWLSVPAVAFGAWQAWRRRSGALLFVLVAFLALWLPWARIDRVAFNYHYFAALPFALLLLAYLLVELLGRPSAATIRYGRVAMTAMLLLPGFLWLQGDPFCTAAGAGEAARICQVPVGEALPQVLLWAGAALAVPIWLVLRDPRHLVWAYLVLAAVAFAALYPALAAAQVPAGWPLIYQGMLPTWNVTFAFGNNEAAPVAVTVLSAWPVLIAGVTAVVAAIAMRIAHLWDWVPVTPFDAPEVERTPEPSPRSPRRRRRQP